MNVRHHINRLVDCSLADIEPFSNLPLTNSGFCKASDSCYLFLGEFGVSMFRAAQGYCSALFFHVLHIIAVCAKKEVVGVHASPVVAFMQNIQTVRYITVEDNPRGSVCSYCLPFVRKAPIFIIGAFASSPFPTTIVGRLVDLGKESLYNAISHVISSLSDLVRGLDISVSSAPNYIIGDHHA